MGWRELHTFSSASLDENIWSGSRSGSFNPGKDPLYTLNMILGGPLPRVCPLRSLATILTELSRIMIVKVQIKNNLKRDNRQIFYGNSPSFASTYREKYAYSYVNRLTPNDPCMGRTAPLTSKRCILYIY